MAEPTGWDTREPLCGENDPYGREDTANKYAKTLWSNFIAEHNSSDGSHTFSGDACTIEYGTYTGTGIEHAVELENSSLLVKQILVKADNAALYPGWGFFSGSSAFTDLSTPGEFTVGTNVYVNTLDETYYYIVWGVES